jgi:hypothetical protein
MTEKTVGAYIAGLQGWKAEVASKVRQIVLEAAPDSVESIKWAQPVFEANGPCCYMKAFKNSVNLGFWRGVELEDPEGLLLGTGEEMRHVKLAGIQDVDEAALAGSVRQAVQLNLSKGDPTKGR